jgi:hypothetical protein
VLDEFSHLVESRVSLIRGMLVSGRYHLALKLKRISHASGDEVFDFLAVDDEVVCEAFTDFVGAHPDDRRGGRVRLPTSSVAALGA